MVCMASIKVLPIRGATGIFAGDFHSNFGIYADFGETSVYFVYRSSSSQKTYIRPDSCEEYSNLADLFISEGIQGEEVNEVMNMVDDFFRDQQ